MGNKIVHLHRGDRQRHNYNIYRYHVDYQKWTKSKTANLDIIEEINFQTNVQCALYQYGLAV